MALGLVVSYDNMVSPECIQFDFGLKNYASKAKQKHIGNSRNDILGQVKPQR
jgi:hypothetical protein